MSFQTASAALQAMRASLHPEDKDGALWNLSVALEEISRELDQRLSKIEANQQRVLQLLGRLQ